MLEPARRNSLERLDEIDNFERVRLVRGKDERVPALVRLREIGEICRSVGVVRQGAHVYFLREELGVQAERPLQVLGEVLRKITCRQCRYARENAEPSTRTSSSGKCAPFRKIQPFAS